MLVVVLPEHHGIRLDQVLFHVIPEISRTFFQKLIDDGKVFVSGRIQKKGYKVVLGEEISFEIPKPEPLHLTPESIPLSILYEDDLFIVVNKQPGLVVHPGAGNRTGTFVNALLHHLGSIDHDDPIRQGIVHRLDKDTSGVLIAAKNSFVHAHLSHQFAARTVEKHYLALVSGVVNAPSTVDSPIGRDPKNRLKMAVIETGRPALSIITPVKYSKTHSLIDVQLVTGRTHQIRVHLKHIGHPIVGDVLYGGHKVLCDRQMLHCRTMTISHPRTDVRMVFEAPLFPDMEQLCEQLYSAS